MLNVTDMAISAKVVDTFANTVSWTKAIKKAVSTSRSQRVNRNWTPKKDSKQNF